MSQRLVRYILIALIIFAKAVIKYLSRKRPAKYGLPLAAVRVYSISNCHTNPNRNRKLINIFFFIIVQALKYLCIHIHDFTAQSRRILPKLIKAC